MQDDFKIKYIKCSEEDLIKIGFDKTYTKKGIEKHKFQTVKICGLTCAQANILKQIAISAGTDCAVHRETITGKIEKSDCILSGSINQFRKIIEKLKHQPLKLSILAENLEKLLFKSVQPFYAKDFAWKAEKTTYLMGILNVTPDSFSDGGQFNTLQSAISQYQRLVNDGADIIDIGGESTRPSAATVSVEEEIERVIPVIEQIRIFDKTTVISIDTRNALTAKKAVEAGANIVNDISSGDWDPGMFEIIKEKNCPIILNHSNGSPETMQNNTDYNDVVDDIFQYFQRKIEKLELLGVKKNKIILDPGIGFGKTTEQNFELINRIEEFYSLGCPLLVGHSRKAFLQKTILTKDNEDLDLATLLISQKLMDKNVNILRVHNIREHKILEKLYQSLV